MLVKFRAVPNPKSLWATYGYRVVQWIPSTQGLGRTPEIDITFGGQNLREGDECSGFMRDRLAAQREQRENERTRKSRESAEAAEVARDKIRVLTDKAIQRISKRQTKLAELSDKVRSELDKKAEEIMAEFGLM